MTSLMATDLSRKLAVNSMRLSQRRIAPRRTILFWLHCLVVACVVPAVAVTTIIINHSFTQERASLERDSVGTARALSQTVDAELIGARSALLIGVGGMLLGLDSSIDPLTGTRILLSLFAAAVLGGLGSAPGAVLGAFLIGMAEELSVLVVGSQYRAAVGFVAILLVLTLRPRGLLGERAF